MSKTIWLVIIVIIVALGYTVFMRPPQASAPSPTSAGGSIAPVAGPTVSVQPNPVPSPNQVSTSTPNPAPSPLPQPVKKTPPSPTPTPAPPVPSMVPTKEVTVQATEYAFSPSTIVVAPGQKVKVTLTNGGSAPHDFVIDGITTSSVISGSNQTVVDFTAPKKIGTYPIYCSVGAHRSLGMEGKLIVQ